MRRAGQQLVTFAPHPLVPLGPTINLALVAAGGVGYGMVPAEAAFRSDVRCVPGMTRASVEADLAAFLEQARREQAGLDATLDFWHWLPPCEIAPEHAVVRAIQAAAAGTLGAAPPLGSFPGGTDAPYLQLDAGIPTVPSFGPGLLTEAHRPNESISTQSLVEAAHMYADAALRFLDG
jgi:acetylornithine deacetylase